MRVLFDAYWWHEGPISNRHVMRSIVTTWLTAFPNDESMVLVRRAGLAQAQADIGARAVVRGVAAWPQAALASMGTALAAKTFKPDLVVTHNFASLSRPSAVFIHDLMFEDWPQFFTRGERAYFSAMLPLARRADFVFTSSRTESVRIAKHLKRAVVPVGLAVPEELIDARPVVPPGYLAPRGFLLSVGRLNARKNLSNVIQAMVEEGLATPQFPLVVVGESQGRPEDGLEVLRNVPEGAVRFLGKVSVGQLRWLYENARASLCFSLDEGFGMPLIESMAFGTPVVTSDTAVFSEVTAGLSRTADPRSPAAIGRAVAAELADPLTGSRMADLREQSMRTGWSDVVRSLRSATGAP